MAGTNMPARIGSGKALALIAAETRGGALPCKRHCTSISREEVKSCYRYCCTRLKKVLLIWMVSCGRRM